VWRGLSSPRSGGTGARAGKPAPHGGR
jgi:hypothetical protein